MALFNKVTGSKPEPQKAPAQQPEPQKQPSEEPSRQGKSTQSASGRNVLSSDVEIKGSVRFF